MYNKKLESLKEELKITMVHAEEIINEYIETAVKQEVANYINQLDETEQMILVFSLLSEMEPQPFDELVNTIKQEEEPEKEPEEEPEDHNDDEDYVRSLIEYVQIATRLRNMIDDY
jgi:hypothetical protein